MKKLFYFLLIGLILLIAIYWLKNRDEVFNYEYQEENIYIEYPYFKTSWLDDVICDYLNEKISSFKYSDMEELFMDYDYDIKDANLNLVFYTYEYQENKKRTSEIDFLINLETQEVVSSSSKETSLEYDIYMERVIDASKPMIAFTFDDGPSHNTTKIIDILNRYHVRATFFLLGVNIEGNEDIVFSLKESGMEIGNHTYSHSLLTGLSETKIKEELEQTKNLIYDVTGSYPVLTRPSYGSVNQKVKRVIDTPIIGWNIDTLDWKYHNSNYIMNQILDKVSDGNIILMHDIYTATSNALDKVIPELIRRGYQLVTVSELFYYKNIELEKGKVYRYAKG